MPQMPQAPDWKQALEAGMQFTQMRRSQARAIANDLADKGQLARDQIASAVDDLVDMSKRRTDELGKIVQKEVQRQLGALGVATKSDIAALERRLAKATKETKRADRVRASGATTKKSAAKKSPTKKSAAKKPAAKKSAAKKSAAAS
jgi:polyhydroxyalkanoate synthesis regulator phasin